MYCLDPNALKIHIDGSAFNNPGHGGGLAAIIEYPESFNRECEIIFREGYAKTTNNRMELRACIKAFEYIIKNVKQLGINRVIIITDSIYVSQNQNNSIFWKKNHWRNKDNRPIENSDLWNKFLLLRQKIRVSTEIQWQPGKSDRVSKDVDVFAKNAAKKVIKAVDSGYQPGKISRTKTPEISAPTLFPAQGQKVIIRIYQYKKIYRKEEYRIVFDLFAKKENNFIAKHCAYVLTREVSDIHRHKCYRARFNDNADYPIIKTLKLLESCPV